MSDGAMAKVHVGLAGSIREIVGQKEIEVCIDSHSLWPD
jgi:hypothetical protein